MSTPLAIVGCGAVTPVGLSAPQTCAAIRARISGVREIAVAPPDFAAVSGADVPARAALKEPIGQWVVSLACRAIQEALSAEAPDTSATSLLLLMRQSAAAPIELSPSATSPWIKSIEARLNRRFHSSSSIFGEGHAAVILALHKARELLTGREIK